MEPPVDLPVTTHVTPKLHEAFRLLMPIAYKWKTIGTLLQVKNSSLNNIKKDNQNESEECLQEMLGQWLRQVDPQPSWQALVDVVKEVDPNLADKIYDKVLK